MPQTDIVSFFSQYFWLSISLFSFIIILSNNILPFILEIIYIRNKLKNNTNILLKSNIDNKLLTTYFKNLTINLLKINNKNPIFMGEKLNNEKLLNVQNIYLNNILNFQLNNYK